MSDNINKNTNSNRNSNRSFVNPDDWIFGLDTGGNSASVQKTKTLKSDSEKNSSGGNSISNDDKSNKAFEDGFDFSFYKEIVNNRTSFDKAHEQSNQKNNTPKQTSSINDRIKYYNDNAKFGARRRIISDNDNFSKINNNNIDKVRKEDTHNISSSKPAAYPVDWSDYNGSFNLDSDSTSLEMTSSEIVDKKKNDINDIIEISETIKIDEDKKDLKSDAKKSEEIEVSEIEDVDDVEKMKKFLDTMSQKVKREEDLDIIIDAGKELEHSLVSTFVKREEKYDVMISAGRAHNLMLRSDGTVWSWGVNNNGQLGTGTVKDAYYPQRIKGLHDIVYICSNEDTNIAIKNDGIAYIWGIDPIFQKELKINTRPEIIQNVKNVCAVSIGSKHAVFLRNDGNVCCVGENNYGQLGFGIADINRNIGEVNVVRGLKKVKQVACGLNHTVVLQDDGTVVTWGANNFGQLGNGTKNPVNSIVRVNIEDVIFISAYGDYSVAVKQDGSVWVWGKKFLGETVSDDKTLPTLLEGIGKVKTVTLRKDFLLFKKDDGTLVMLDTNNMKYDILSIKFSLKRVRKMTAGDEHFVVIASDGTVWTWGKNSNGQIGDDSTKDRETPQPLGINVFEHYLVFEIGNANMIVDGIVCEVDPGRGTVPFMKKEKIMVPLGIIARKIGATVGWKKSEMKAEIIYKGKTLTLWAGKAIILVNGREEKVDYSPEIVNKRIMVPIDFVSNKLGVYVDYYKDDKRFTILY